MALPSPPPPKPERITIAGSLEIPRIINGLWQLTGGHDDIPAGQRDEELEILEAAEAMNSLIELGLDAFDVADHYGDAELVIGAYNQRYGAARPITAFTKWCPAEGPPPARPTTPAIAEAAVARASQRMHTPLLPLLQYHAWDYTDSTYLFNLAHLRSIQQRSSQGEGEGEGEGEGGVAPAAVTPGLAHIGVTNVDTAHLELLLHSGLRIATNQVSVSVLDGRLTHGPRMAALCAQHGVGVLAYGSLLGGFLSEQWLGRAEPYRDHGPAGEPLNASLRKYLRFIHAAGGWGVFQGVLRALYTVARKHGVRIPAVAIRWVLDQPAVSAVIVGARLSAGGAAVARQAAANLEAFSFALDDEDREMISAAQKVLRDIPGDCGDEYRRPPYLTATGDLSQHLQPDLLGGPSMRLAEAVAAGRRIEFRTGTRWELVAGYSRALRIGDTIHVSGTTANPPPELAPLIPVVGGACARCQAVAALDIVSHALRRLGGAVSDVVRTRLFVRREEDCEAVSRVHGWLFHCEGVRPANTLLLVAGLVPAEMLVEVEAEAVVESGASLVVLS